MHDFEMAQLVVLLCALIQAPLKPLLKVGDAPMIPLAKPGGRKASTRAASVTQPSSVSIAAEISRNLRCPICQWKVMETSFFRSFCGVLHRLFWPGVCHEMIT